LGILLTGRQAPARVEASNTDVARHDPALCLMPGLFRVASDEDQNARVSLMLKQTHGDYTVELHNSCVLSGHDLAVLQAIVALAARSSTPDQLDPTDLCGEVARALVDTLAATLPGAALTEAPTLTDNVLHVDFSGANMLELIGWPEGGKYRQLLKDCLMRLATCVVVVYRDGQRHRAKVSHLLSHVVQDGSSKKWSRTHVALYPRLTEIIIGSLIPGQRDSHTVIAQAEARLLGMNQGARILHQRLSGFVTQGQRRTLKVSTLLSYLFPNDESGRTLAARAAGVRGVSVTNPAEIARVKREHLKVLDSALETLQQAGWGVGLSAQMSMTEVRYLEPGLLKEERDAKEAQFVAWVDQINAEAARDPALTRLTIRRPGKRY